MSNEESRPSHEEAAPNRPGGPAPSVPGRTDIETLNALSTPDLKRLIGALQAAYTSACELPDVFSDYDDLITTAAIARRVLKVRLAQERIAEARRLLGILGRPS